MLATTSVLRRVQESTPVQGESLRELLARGVRPDRTKLIDWGSQLLGILAEAHAEGLLHGDLREEDVILTLDGHLAVTFDPFPAEEPSSVQSDLYSVGCLLWRLAFAASIRGGRSLGARDPLVKVLARATFANPAARYQSAAEMAEALREAGQAAVAPGPRRLEERTALSNVAEFPHSTRPAVSPPPQLPKQEEGDLWYAMVLLVASLLLLSFALATGWFILDRDRSAPPVSGASILRAPHPGPSAVFSR